LCCKNDDDTILVKRLRWFDIDRESTKTGFLGEREYDAVNIGYKYHMNDIAASIGIENLKHIDDKLKKIRNIAKQYEGELNNISYIKLMNYDPDRLSSYWLFPMLVENRNEFIKHMRKHNIPVSVVHLGIDDNTIFGGMCTDLTNQRWFDNHQIHIPIHDALTDKQVETIIKTIKEF
jgi:perosamine synthetase